MAFLNTSGIELLYSGVIERLDGLRDALDSLQVAVVERNPSDGRDGEFGASRSEGQNKYSLLTVGRSF
jgi:hypothetical protein